MSKRAPSRDDNDSLLVQCWGIFASRELRDQSQRFSDAAVSLTIRCCPEVLQQVWQTSKLGIGLGVSAALNKSKW